MTQHPVSPYVVVGGLVYFARMTDKIRLHARGALAADCVPNLGIFFDERCANFLRVPYAKVVEWVKSGASDEVVLERCYEEGRRPDSEEIETWNGFMMKRGWRDAQAGRLAQRKAEGGFSDREDIATMFDYIDADEGRSPGSHR